MSYRRAWQLLDSLNHCFRERVAVTAKGGRRGCGGGTARKAVPIVRHKDR